MSALQGVAYPICWVCFIITVIVISYPEWQVNTTQGEVVEQLTRTQGLWVKCTFHPTGNWQCDDYDRYFRGSLPGAIIGARLFCMMACIFQFINICLIPFGMDCTKIPEPATKRVIVLANGILAVASGVVMGIAASWYAALVQGDMQAWAGQNMRNSVETSNQQYKYGICLYLGWGVMVGCIAQGAAMCITYANFDEQSAQTQALYGGGQELNDNMYNMSPQYQPANTHLYDQKPDENMQEYC